MVRGWVVLRNEGNPGNGEIILKYEGGRALILLYGLLCIYIYIYINIYIYIYIYI